MEELWATILGAVLIISAGILLLIKIRRWSFPVKMPRFKILTISQHLSFSRKSIFFGAIILFTASAIIFTGNQMIGSKPASEDTSQSSTTVATPPEQVSVEFRSSSVFGKENSTVPLKVKISNNGDSAIQNVRFEGQTEGIAISPKNSTLLTVNFEVKSFASHRNMNATLFYNSNGNSVSKQVETPIYPVPNAAINGLEYKREAHNFIFSDQMEPGKNATLKVTVINRGATKLTAGSIQITGFTEDLEAAANVSKEVDVGLNKNGEYSYEIILRISENPPYGDTQVNVALLYNDTVKGNMILDQRSIPVKIVAGDTLRFNRLF